MRVLLAVIEDLYIFAVYMLFGQPSQKDAKAPLHLPPAHAGTLSTDVAVTALVASDVVQAYEEPMQEEAVVENGLPQKNTIVYCARAQVPLRTTPDSASDTAIATVSYGDMLMVLNAGEEWSYVAAGNKQGYVPTSVLAHTAASVHPEFAIGTENGPRAISTTRVRNVIRDEFSASLNQLPLQAHEYVYYKLVRRGVHIAWPDIRPRTPGAWARILSLLDGITVGHVPTAGSVMEFTLHDGRGHLAYVERVFPDLSIHVSETDWPDRGIYNERVLVENEWRALTPSFIIFS